MPLLAIISTVGTIIAGVMTLNAAWRAVPLFEGANLNGLYGSLAHFREAS